MGPSSGTDSDSTDPVGSEPPASAAPTQPPAPVGELSGILGLPGKRHLVLEHELLSKGHVYRVRDAEKRSLFEVREEVWEEFKQNLSHPSPNASPGIHVTFFWGAPPWAKTVPFSILDSTGTLCGRISLQMTRDRATSVVSDSEGRPVVFFDLARGALTSVAARASDAQGRALFVGKGSVFHGSYDVTDATGAELAKVEHHALSVHGSYTLEFLGNADPVSVVTFAIMIDHERNQGGDSSHPGPQRGLGGGEPHPEAPHHR